MGHTKKKKPRSGSLAFWPRVRARRIYPRVRNFARSDQPKLLGFAAYKAGMSAVHIIDNRPKSPTKGERIRVPVTILEAPPLIAIGIRLYKKGYEGLQVAKEVWADKLPKELGRKINLPKKRKWSLEDLKADLENAAEIRLLVCTQPKRTTIGKKKPEILELPIGGDVKAQFEYAQSVLGKEIAVDDVFKPGELLDVHAVTKGKGFQGVIQRFGVKLERHKAEKGRRKIATMGPWTPKWTPWWIAQPGQMGFHTRTEYNKQLLKIGDPQKEPITPAGGLIRYGEVRNRYLLLAGSVPGHKKRLVVLSHAIRPPKSAFTQPPEIVAISTRSQQG